MNDRHTIEALLVNAVEEFLDVIEIAYPYVLKPAEDRTDALVANAINKANVALARAKSARKAKKSSDGATNRPLGISVRR